MAINLDRAVVLGHSPVLIQWTLNKSDIYRIFGLILKISDNPDLFGRYYNNSMTAADYRTGLQ